jgi:cytidylate kinase
MGHGVDGSRMVIAIDGPAAAGKSTTARGIARRLGLLYVDTGAMYRALSIKVVRQGVDAGDAAAVAALLPGTTVSLAARPAEPPVAGSAVEPAGAPGRVAVLLDGEDVSGLLRTEQVGEVASTIAQHRAVRAFLVEQQRRLAAGAGVVMEGRDIGTIVLPDADLKVYLVAGTGERARRRQQEMAERGTELELDEVRRMIVERDRRDREREESPLVAAPDAVTIDTTDLTIEGQIEAVIAEVERRLAAAGIPDRRPGRGA